MSSQTESEEAVSHDSSDTTASDQPVRVGCEMLAWIEKEAVKRERSKCVRSAVAAHAGGAAV